MLLDNLIFDRTAQDVAAKLPKGTYTEADIRRIDVYMQRIAEHYDIYLPRLLTDGATLDTLTYSLISQMVDNANTIRSTAGIASIVPAAKLRNRWGFERANEVEKILYEAYRQIVQMVSVEVVGEDIEDVSEIGSTAYGYPLYVQIKANENYALPTSIEVRLGAVDGDLLPAGNYTYTRKSGMIFIPPQYVVDNIYIIVDATPLTIFTAFIQDVNCTVSATDRETQTAVNDGDFVTYGHHIDWSAVADSGYIIIGPSSGSVQVTGDVTIRVVATANAYILSIRATHCQVGVSVYRESVGRLQQLFDGDIIFNGEVLFWTAVADEGYLIWGPSSGTKDVTGNTTVAVVATRSDTLQTPYLEYIGKESVKVEWQDDRISEFLIYDDNTLLGSADAITGEFTPVN